MFSRSLAAAGVCLVFAAAVGAQSTSTVGLLQVTAAAQNLNMAVPDALRRTGVPGMAIAVVYKDQLVLLKGYGLRKTGESAAVDPDTVFQLASLSKPITATVLAAMAGSGYLGWDNLITDLDPSFKLSDPWVTGQLTIRDLMSHRSGLPEHSGDILEDLGYDRSDILRRLRFLSLARFRQDYLYTNFGITEAAQAAALSYGHDWDSTAAKLLFTPAGMKATSTTYADSVKRPNRAALHVPVNGTMIAKYQRNADAEAPAGGVSSSARDMAQWLRLLLGRGTVDGVPVVDTLALEETWEPQILRSVDPANGKAAFYGLGWNVDYDSNGKRRISHSGAFSRGAGTTVTMYPEDQVAIVVLTNGFPMGLAEAMSSTFYDLLFHGSNNSHLQQDWIAVWASAFQQAFADPITDYSKLQPPYPAMPQTLPLSAYTGTYYSDYYGNLQVSQQGNDLTMSLGPIPSSYALTPWDGNTFTYFFDTESGTGTRAVVFKLNSDSSSVQQVLLDNLTVDGDGLFSKIDSVAANSGLNPARNQVPVRVFTNAR